MRVMRLSDVDQGQHHENKGLQSDDQNVEDGPDGTGNDVADGQQNAAQAHGSSAAHEGDQHENEFTGVHIAEQWHAVRHGFGDEFNHLETEIDGPQNRVCAEWGCGEFVQPAANAFDFDVVEQTNQQNRHRHPQSGGQISGGDHAELMDAVV